MRKPDKEFFAKYLTGNVTPSGEQRAFCPLCEDPATSNSDSASLNWENRVWHCKSCGNGGSIKNLRLQIIRGKQSNKLHEAKVTPISNGKELPSEQQLQHWHDRLMMMPAQLDFLSRERGLLQETISDYLIGYDGQRYTLPVRDVRGELLNVRRYNPRATKAADKMLSIEGHGQARIFRPDLLLRSDRVVLTEGELDMIVGRQYGIPTITHTAGAGTFLPVWGPLFAGKEVYICYDCDDAGRAGAIKAAKVLRQHADLVCLVNLDLDIKGGDLTDFLVKQGNTKAEFERLMDEASKHPIGAKRVDREVPKTGKPVTLENTQSTQYGDEPLEMIVTVAGKQTPAYQVPREVVGRCSQDKGTVCAVCPMAALNGEAKQSVQANDPTLLEFIGVNKTQVEKNYRKLFGARCVDRIEYDVEQYWTVEELTVTDSVEHRQEEEQTPLSRRLLNVGTYSTRLNSTARVVGRQLPSPETQRGELLSWHLEQTEADLDRFEMSPAMYRKLKKFQPSKSQTPIDKMKEVVHDLAANVTQIYGRPELHMAYDLVWHSILSFRFMGRPIGKGWLELLVVGDTRTGKSEAATKLIHHYNSGVLKSCEGATFAGLVGGAQQLGGKTWTITWGTIPLNDRRLVVLDEMGGISEKGVIENMSSVRSSGIAQITKIQQAQTSARTRLVWIANPADGRRMEDYGSGMAAIPTLVKNPEDIARFDFAMAAASDDVPLKTITPTNPEQVRHRYDADSCGSLVMWAWSRNIEDVEWDKGAERYVVEMASSLGQRYVNEPPLVQFENARVKVARVAAAIAARCFSTEDGDKLLIRKEHVDAAIEFLDMVYGMESFGYLRHSRKVLAGRAKAEHEKNRVQKWLRENDSIRHTMLSIQGDFFRNRDFQDLAGMDQYEAQGAVRYLLEKRMIRRMSKGYLKMEPALVRILNRLADEEEA